MVRRPFFLFYMIRFRSKQTHYNERYWFQTYFKGLSVCQRSSSFPFIAGVLKDWRSIPACHKVNCFVTINGIVISLLSLFDLFGDAVSRRENVFRSSKCGNIIPFVL